jgi:hypothetical protein
MILPEWYLKRNICEFVHHCGSDYSETAVSLEMKGQWSEKASRIWRTIV